MSLHKRKRSESEAEFGSGLGSGSESESESESESASDDDEHKSGIRAENESKLESGSIHTSNDACISSHAHVAEPKYILYIATNGEDTEERRKHYVIRAQHAFCCDRVAKIGNLHLHISMYVYKYIYT